MSSTEETYRTAAKEHLERARKELKNGSYYLSHYLSGLAVECHLRAWLRRRTDEFDSRHDLALLAKESEFYSAVPIARGREFASEFTKINLRWRSNHRYYSERQLLDYLTSIKAEFNSKGDRWKNLARALYDSASAVIKQGEVKWSRKSQTS